MFLRIDGECQRFACVAASVDRRACGPSSGFLHNFKGEYEQALQLQEQGFTSGQAHNLHYLLLWTLWTRSLTRCARRTKQAQAVHASAIEMIEGVASGLQDQELKQTFLSARPVQEIRERLGHLT